jgi:mRNA interferase RelE/StbE
MAWSVEFHPDASRELDRLDPQIERRIRKFLLERLATLEDPRSIGKALQGAELGKYWSYRVGDFRLICEFINDRLVVLVLRVGHRKEIYR